VIADHALAHLADFLVCGANAGMAATSKGVNWERDANYNEWPILRDVGRRRFSPDGEGTWVIPPRH